MVSCYDWEAVIYEPWSDIDAGAACSPLEVMSDNIFLHCSPQDSAVSVEQVVRDNGKLNNADGRQLSDFQASVGTASVLETARSEGDSIHSQCSLATVHSKDSVWRKEQGGSFTAVECVEESCSGKQGKWCCDPLPSYYTPSRRQRSRPLNAIDERLCQFIDDIDGMAWHAFVTQQQQQHVPCQIVESKCCKGATTAEFDCDEKGRIVIPTCIDGIDVMQQVEVRPPAHECLRTLTSSGNGAKCYVETCQAEIRILAIMRDVFANKLRMGYDCCATLRRIDRCISERQRDVLRCNHLTSCSNSCSTDDPLADGIVDKNTATDYFSTFLDIAIRANQLIHTYRTRNVTVRTRRNKRIPAYRLR